jgi:hypothetical protein
MQFIEIVILSDRSEAERVEGPAVVFSPLQLARPRVPLDKEEGFVNAQNS